MPKKLSPQAVDLVEDLLAKGIIHRLCLCGGWRESRSLQQGAVRKGRLWERHPELSLRYSKFTMELLCWLTERAIDQSKLKKLSTRPQTLGDQLVALFALDMAVALGAGQGLAADPALQGSALCWLAHPDALGAGSSIEVIQFETLLQDEGAIILEALGPNLRDRWLALERSKGTIHSLDRMSRIGDAQRRVLQDFLQQAAAAGREDLAFFVVQAAASLAQAWSSSSLACLARALRSFCSRPERSPSSCARTATR